MKPLQAISSVLSFGAIAFGIAFGNGAAGHPTNTLFFTAGPGDGSQGLYGRIDSQ